MHGSVALWIEKCREAINMKEGKHMCGCKKITMINVNHEVFEFWETCKGLGSIIVHNEKEIYRYGAKHDEKKSYRDELSAIIQSLDDCEVQRLMGYLEGWRDSDNE